MKTTHVSTFHRVLPVPGGGGKRSASSFVLLCLCVPHWWKERGFLMNWFESRTGWSHAFLIIRATKPSKEATIGRPPYTCFPHVRELWCLTVPSRSQIAFPKWALTWFRPCRVLDAISVLHQDECWVLLCIASLVRNPNCSILVSWPYYYPNGTTVSIWIPGPRHWDKFYGNMTSWSSSGRKASLSSTFGRPRQV